MAQAGRALWGLLIAVLPELKRWRHRCGYANCNLQGPAGFYCREHREPLHRRLEFWWRVTWRWRHG